MSEEVFWIIQTSIVGTIVLLGGLLISTCDQNAVDSYHKNGYELIHIEGKSEGIWRKVGDE
jgi:hypothetical protein